MIYVYNAGPLFSEADIKQRKYEGNKLRELLSNLDSFVANPIDLPFDNSRVLTSKEIFEEDVKHIDLANVFFFELATGDTGTMVEFGQVIEKLRNKKEILIYPIFSDLRLARNNAVGVECPIGFNSFLVGACTSHNLKIYDTFEEAFEAFKRDLTR